MGGGRHGAILAQQMMDVAIRVAAIRPFATQQMALLVENSAVIMAKGRRNSSAEVLYAAGWLVGEFCEHLTSPVETLQAMLRALSSSLPPHIQAVFIQNGLKLWAAHCIGQGDVEEELIQRLELLVGSEALEVQERSSTGLHLLRYVAKQREKGEVESVKTELETFFAGELNPVAPKAQRKVPVPEGLDLDAWINEPEVEEEDEDSEDDMKSLGGQVFVRDEPEQQRRRTTVEPTQEELSAARSSRLHTQSNDVNYLKDTPKASPCRERPESVADIPIQTIDLEVPLHIPGLASTDSYYNLSETGSNTGKKSKKKKKKAKKVEVASSDSEEAGPNVFVSRNIDLPEGASISDLDRSDSDDKDDPHKALGNIVLDDFLDPLPVKEKSSKKKSKSDNLTVSPELTVEHKTHKKEKKKKSANGKEDVDLLGLEQLEMSNGQKEEKSRQWNWSGESFSLSLELASCRVEMGDGIFSLSCELSVTNTGPTKLSGLRVGSAVLAGKSSSLAKSLKCGATKSKAVSLSLTGEREASLEVCLSWEGGSQQLVTIPLPSPAWLVHPPPCYDIEQYAELLLSGRLQHSAARQLTLPSQPFTTFAQNLASELNLGVVEIQESSASLYGEVVGGGQLAFMLKVGSGGAVAFEGRCVEEEKETLAGVLDWASQLL